MEKEFIRVRSMADWTISLLLIAAGIIIVALPTSTSVNITGFFMAIAGIILAAILKTGYKDTSNGEKFRKKELFFPQSSKSRIMELLASDISLIEPTGDNNGNGLRMEIYVSRSGSHAYIRLYEYVPYKYVPASQVYAVDKSQISKLIK